MENTDNQQTRLVTARFAVLAIFFVNGAAFASWIPHIPFVQAQHSLGEGALGLALLCIALGGLVAMNVTGWLISRVGSRIVTTTATILFCLLLPMPVLAPTVTWLVIALLIFGVANGAMDVAMNTQGVAVEQGYGQPVLSSMHALFSIGGLTGAGLCGLALAMNFTPSAHIVIAAVVLSVVGIIAAFWLLPPAADVKSEGASFARPTGPLLGLGILAFICLMGEGAMADWSAVYLRFVVGADAAMAAAGFAAFSMLMAVGRLLGDKLIHLLGSVWMLRFGSLLAAVGFALALAVGDPLLSIVGFGLVGLGLANVVPVLFRAGAAVPGVAPGTGIAAVATLGYCGFLGGPPLIGFTAEVITLQGALALVALSLGLIAVLANLVKTAD
jgi:predicted MFS family arabinose efflux permease